MIGRQKHCIALSEFSREELLQVLDLAVSMKEVLRRPIKKVPSLRGKSIINLFFEASTRTLLCGDIFTHGGAGVPALTENTRGSAPAVDSSVAE